MYQKVLFYLKPMTAYNKEHTERMIEMLKAISRTQLMASSKEEFGRMLGHNLKDNSLGKILKGDFSVNATFHELKHIVSHETQGMVDLETFMIEYERTSAYYMKKLRSFFDPSSPSYKEKLFAMMDYLFFYVLDIEPERDTQWDDEWKTIYGDGAELDIVLLMALEILPAYSGKSKKAERPLGVIREFLTEYADREDGMMQGSHEYTQMLIYKDFNLSYRIKAVAVLYYFVRIARKSFCMDLPREVMSKAKEIPMLDINKGKDAPIIWCNDNDKCCFWYFVAIEGAYNMVQCDYVKKTYTNYTLFLGSELDVNIGRVLHPLHIISFVENGQCSDKFIMARWNIETDKEGNGTKLLINNISHFQSAPEWIEPFRSLRLSRMRNDAFEECFEKNAKGLWKLKNSFCNAFPDTDSIFVKSLFSISHKELQIQDVRLTKDGHELIKDKFFHLPIEYANTELRLNDNIGILIIGTWDKPGEQRKYLALDCFSKYYPIIDGTIQIS